MKQLITMGTAIVLCLVLFIILKPLAASPTIEEQAGAVEPKEQNGQAGAEDAVSGSDADKIAEFPIFPEQREKLQMLQQERQERIKGMEPVQIEVPSIGVMAKIEAT